MKFLYVMKEYVGLSVSWLCFSKSCCICHGPSIYRPVCKTCSDHYTRELESSLSARRCRYCGRLLLSEQSVCTECRKDGALFRQHDCLMADPFPVFPYLGKRKRLLTVWKITGERSLSYLYAAWLNTVLAQRYDGIPVVPVPPRRNKLKEKGWDQIEELCRILESVYGRTVCRLLQRTTLIQQKKLTREQRLGSEGAGYAPIPECQLQQVLKGQPVPQTVVLLDDVITTGATIMHAAEALHREGVKTVYPVSLFYVP